MKIELDHLIPEFLQNKNPSGNLWNNKICIESPQKYLINAKSGKGKSTFLSYINGIRKDFNGSIFFDDKNINRFTIDDWALYRKEMVSMVFQELRLFPNLTALENVKLKNDLTKHLTYEVTLDLFSRFGIADQMNQPCRFLSLGQQQRVAIIRALHQPFKFILLDEPFSHLDKENSENAFQIINEYCILNNASYILTSLEEIDSINFDKIFTI